jgi:AraC family transcriptional regulator
MAIDPTFDKARSAPLTPPRIERHPPLLIAGLCERLAGNPADTIPALWRRFAPHIGSIPGQVDNAGYGVCLPSERDAACFDYVAGCEVSGFAGLPADWRRVRIAAHRYAIFPHRHNVAELQHTVRAIFTVWLPESGFEPVPAGAGSPGFFERYGAGFDARTGAGDIEIWLPLQA